MIHRIEHTNNKYRSNKPIIQQYN